MQMYSRRDVTNIIEDFLAKHFNFGSIYLNAESHEELDEICLNYGVEVENIIEQ